MAFLPHWKIEMDFVSCRDNPPRSPEFESPIQGGFSEQAVRIPDIRITGIGLKISSDVLRSIHAEPEERTSLDAVSPAHDEETFCQLLDRRSEAEEYAGILLSVDEVVVIVGSGEGGCKIRQGGCQKSAALPG